jgi:hypothetical protein
MSSMSFIIGVVIFSVLAWYIGTSIHSNNVRKQRRLMLLQRPVLSREEWYIHKFLPLGVQREMTERICGALAKVLKCDITQIWPFDHFSVELGAPKATVMGLDDDIEMENFCYYELELILGSELNKKLLSSSERVSTVGDLVKWCENELHVSH